MLFVILTIDLKNLQTFRPRIRSKTIESLSERITDYDYYCVRKARQLSEARFHPPTHHTQFILYLKHPFLQAIMRSTRDTEA